MTFPALFLLTTLLVGSAAADQSPAPPSDKPSAAAIMASREVAVAAEAIVAAFGRHDPRAYFALFAPDATFVFYTAQYRINSRADYETEWARWEKEDAFRVHFCRSTEQRVQLLGDVAVFTHSVETRLTTTQGPSTLHERETIVFHRRNGKWIAVHEHLSPVPEPTPPAAQ